MTKFSVTSAGDDGTEFKLAGRIDAQSEFPILNTTDSLSFVLDFAGVTSINSIGVKQWIEWMRKYSLNVKFTFKNLPRFFVYQLNVVADLIPMGSVIDSFFAPFYCDTCELDDQVLYQRGRDFGKVENSLISIEDLPHPHKCPKCNVEMEIDAVTNKYFNFLNMYK